MYNKITIELEKELISKINASGLHIATIKLILEKVLRMVNDALEEDLKREHKHIEKQNELYDMVEIDESLIDKNN